MPHVERPILANDRVDRPHPRDVVAPACRASGDRNYQQARGAQAGQRRVRRRRDASVRRKRIVDVGQHAAEGTAHAELAGATQFLQQFRVGHVPFSDIHAEVIAIRMPAGTARSNV